MASGQAGEAQMEEQRSSRPLGAGSSPAAGAGSVGNGQWPVEAAVFLLTGNCPLTTRMLA